MKKTPPSWPPAGKSSRSARTAPASSNSSTSTASSRASTRCSRHAMLALPRSRRFGALLLALVVPTCTNAAPGAGEERDAGRARGDASLPEPPRSDAQDAQVEDLAVPSDVLGEGSPSSETSGGQDATAPDGPAADCGPTSLLCDTLRPLPSS